MIILIHDTKCVISTQKDGVELNEYHKKPLIISFIKIANKYPDELLIWIYKNYQEKVNYGAFKNIFHHNRIMASYTLEQYLIEAIGYVEEGPFIKVNPDVKYPTWRMHQDIGGICTSIINAFSTYIENSLNLNEFLHSIAKLGQAQGLLCYSEPNLIHDKKNLKPILNNDDKITLLFRFVSLHYKQIWKHLLLFNLSIYESKYPILSWIKNVSRHQIIPQKNLLTPIVFNKTRKISTSEIDIDVIIPTIGRRKYLYNVLKDLSKQTILPKRIILIEQNPEPLSESELKYVKDEKWPFKIIHRFIHQTGACNARNKALDLVKSEWVFLADDDIRIENKYLEKCITILKSFKAEALVSECLMENESSQNIDIKSWLTFGSGTSVISSKIHRRIKFNLALEHGYGEDVEFGLKIRNIGYDVLFSSQCYLLHLKAPIGGFRTKTSPIWINSNPIPKPSPTVLLSRLLYNSPQQILGYKTTLFFKTLRKKGVFQFFKHLKYFRKAWTNSLFWANYLKGKDK